MKISRVLLASLALLLIGFVGCKQEAATMLITGEVHLAYYEGGVPSANVQPGDPASNTEVKLYTYKKPESQPQISPIDPRGELLATAVTDDQGKYQFEVQLGILPRGCDRLVIYVDNGCKGGRVIDVAQGTTQVDLIKGTLPVP